MDLVKATLKAQSGSRGPKLSSPIERFWEQVSIPLDPDGCWRWTGSHHKRGYGQFSIKLEDGRWYPAKAHQFVYQLLVGPIPKGQEIDHLCGVRDCVNVAHLELVTHQINLQRKPQPDHCPKGHLFAGANLMLTKKGHRKCRECARQWVRQAQEARTRQ